MWRAVPDTKLAACDWVKLSTKQEDEPQDLVLHRDMGRWPAGHALPHLPPKPPFSSCIQAFEMRTLLLLSCVVLGLPPCENKHSHVAQCYHHIEACGQRGSRQSVFNRANLLGQLRRNGPFTYF